MKGIILLIALLLCAQVATSKSLRHLNARLHSQAETDETKSNPKTEPSPQTKSVTETTVTTITKVTKATNNKTSDDETNKPSVGDATSISATPQT
jgi:hypothetical protein